VLALNSFGPLRSRVDRRSSPLPWGPPWAPLDQAVALDTPPSLRFDGQRIAVVTICAYAEDEPVRELSIRNHRMYCDLHGYDLHMLST
jgi:hypothetical protein